uniref:Uncharacterized protein n=1 Tax=Scophthalmus maximus TaxID=52904 RepID=A0A8D3BZG5_SCOMX
MFTVLRHELQKISGKLCADIFRSLPFTYEEGSRTEVDLGQTRSGQEHSRDIF